MINFQSCIISNNSNFITEIDIDEFVRLFEQIPHRQELFSISKNQIGLLLFVNKSQYNKLFVIKIDENTLTKLVDKLDLIFIESENCYKTLTFVYNKLNEFEQLKHKMESYQKSFNSYLQQNKNKFL